MANIILGELIATGGTSNVYLYGKSAIVKLAKPETPNHYMDYERNIHTIVQKSGLPIPKLLDTVVCDGKKGLVFERLEGHSMLDALKSNPLKMKSYSRDMADLQKDINSTILSGLPRYKDRLLNSINQQKLLGGEKKEAALESLSQMPSGKALCHADLHIGNILISGGKYWIIDWMGAATGDSRADIMHSYALLKYSIAPKNTMRSFAIYSASFSIRAAYVKQIKKVTGFDMEEIFQWQIPILAARLNGTSSEYEAKAILKRLGSLGI